MVCWGASLEEAVKYLENTKEFEEQPLDKIEEDDFTFSYGEKCKMIEDEIILPNGDIMTKLAISHSLAQSVKLGAFEDSITETFNKTRSIPEDLAKRGTISLSRRQIRQKIGELFLERSSINLHVDVLDTPEFFWDYTELEPYYKTIANDLDIETRGQVLNKRLDVVKELFEMLGNELNHQHSSRLEWIIIWLIIIEVVLTLLQIFDVL